MKASIVLVASVAVLASCDSVEERAGCGSSAECPAGQYCANTADGNVCWPDTTAPSVSEVTATCAPQPCLRDGTLHVEARLADDVEVAGAQVTLDAGGAAVSLARSGERWAADVPLRSVPFEWFTHDVVATVVARDGARNASAPVAAAGVGVTRLRWTHNAGVPMTPPAVMADGTAIVGLSRTSNQMLAVTPDGQSSWLATAGTSFITAAPLVAGSSVWIGSEDRNVYEVHDDGAGTMVAMARKDTGGPVRGSLALTTDGKVIAASESGIVFAITSSGYANSGTGSASSLGPVIDVAGTIYSSSGSALRKLTMSGLGIPEDQWSPPASLGLPVAASLAATTSVLAIAYDGASGKLKRVASDATVADLATTGIASDGPAILSDSSILVPEQSRTLSRWSAEGAAHAGWQTPDLGGAARTPLVTDHGATPLVVSTSKGAVHALRPDGTIAWSAQLSGTSAALQAGNIHTPAGQPAGAVLSTAYFAGADGVLYAVIVDGALDAAAPWPKAFHDPRNTNRAGPQP